MMSLASRFKQMFRGVALEVEDLYLLESFQIDYFPGWVTEQELAIVLWAHPGIRRFLVRKHPPIAGFVERIMAQFGTASDLKELQDSAENLVWTIADMLVYNKCPAAYDSLNFHNWDFKEITNLIPLKDQVVIDGGAGTGRVALEAARTARYVFAVEPVTRLRRYIQEKASEAGLRNVFVLDGFLHAIQLPDDFADVLITSHALGWNLEEELAEFERVVRKGGFIVHCPGTAEGEEEQHSRLVSFDWRYEFSRYEEVDGWKRKYWKQL